MTDIDVGEELIRHGWYQGTLLPATSARMSWLALNASYGEIQKAYSLDTSTTTPVIWNLQQALLNEDDWLIVASQTCDIKKSPISEPYIEVLRAYWTTDRSLIHSAGKNSVRYFLVRRRSQEGKVEGLIADATVHIQVEKASLLNCTPSESFQQNDAFTARRFRRWLGSRYNRPALPDELVITVQKPIVKAISKLHESSSLNLILDGISEILIPQYDEPLPYQIDMLFIRDERTNAPVVSDEDKAKLVGWIDDLLQKEGKVKLEAGTVLSMKEISAHDYANAYELSTDQYSLTQDE